jgi:hypothetical protein
MPAATVIRADHPDYYRWQAAAATRRATVLGYAYDPDGMKKAAFTSWVGRTRRNPEPEGETMSVLLGDDFLSKALDDYSQWNRAWWREAIQNCVDAGATRIDMYTKTLDDGRYEVTVTDNGRGMAADILFKKYLSLGSSGKKDSPSATGGFGEAKRLLLFPWCQWTILTNGADGPIGVTGVGFTYKKVQHLDAQGTGTSLIIIMPADKHVDPVDAEWFVSKCYLPNIRITMNGERLDADLECGRPVETREVSSDFMQMYYSPKARKAKGLFVRKNGLLMFEDYAPDLKGVLIGEIVPPSVSVLQSNRDGFRSWSYSTQLNSLKAALSKDTSSAIRKSKQERTRYEGTREIRAEVDNTSGQLFNVLADHFGAASNKKLAAQIAHAAELTMETLTKHAEKPGTFMPTGGVASIILPGCFGADNQQTQIEAAAAQLAWAADFYVVNEIEDFKVPKWLRPADMKARPKKAARLFLEFCRLILIRLGYKHRFGIGWIFSTSEAENQGFARAAYLKDDGVDWLLLNPFVGGNMEKKEIFSIRNKAHINDLFAMALHECTHLVNGISRHDENFSSALTHNIAIVLPSVGLLLQIRDAIAARGGDGDEDADA